MTYTRADRCGVSGNAWVTYLGCQREVVAGGHVVFGIPGMPEGEAMTYHALCLPAETVPKPIPFPAFASSRADTGPASGAARFDGAAGSKPKSSWASGTCTAPAAPHRHQPAAGDAISDGPGRRETATGPTGDAQ